MKTLSRPFRAARLLSLVREVDLGAIKDEADRRFTLSLSGDADLTTPLADLLSATPGRSGAHPYLVQSPKGDTRTSADLELNVVRGLNTPTSSPHPQRRTLTVCIAETDAAPQVVAELPHPGESGRVVLRDLSAENVQRDLVPEILRALSPELRLTVAKQLPIFRPAVIRGLVEEAARANALYAVSTGVAEIVPILNVPLNVADTLVLSKNQLVMAYKVALAAGRTGRPQELMVEIIGVLGSGLLFRQVARGLVGLIPVWGIVPKVAVAYAGTQVIGTAAAVWATEGKTVSAAEVRELYAGALTRGREVAQRLLPARLLRPKRGRAAVIEDGVTKDGVDEVIGELEPAPDPQSK